MQSLKIGTSGEISLEAKVAGQVKSDPISLEQYIKSVEEIGFFDTGLMPRTDTGLINYRRAAGWESFIYQVEAGEHIIIWGKGEGDPDAKYLKVAMPFRIIYGDHKFTNGKWHLIGARHFYSYKPIKSWSDPLFNCNLPNLNCRGYNGTGVGWICLYHRGQDISKLDLMHRCINTAMRTSGEEAYNDYNMSGTDGPRYYEGMNKPKYFTNGAEWAKKTKAEGWKWVIDEKSDLLLPITLENPAKIMMDSNQKGQQATVFDLSRGLYSAYYNDSMYLKPANLMDPTNPFLEHYPSKEKVKTYSHILEFSNGLVNQIKTIQVSGWTPVIKKIKCALSGKEFPESDKWSYFVDKDMVIQVANQLVSQQHIADGNIVNALVDGVDLTPADNLVELCPELKGYKFGSATTPNNYTSLPCLAEDVTVVSKNNGYHRYYHRSLAARQCGACNYIFTRKDKKHPAEEGDNCKSCATKVQCPSCRSMVDETTLKIITKVVYDIKGINLFQDELKKTLIDGKALSELPPMKLGACTNVKIPCCVACATALVQCLSCGRFVSSNDAKIQLGSFGSKHATYCAHCQPKNKKPLKKDDLTKIKFYVGAEPNPIKPTIQF